MGIIKSAIFLMVLTGAFASSTFGQDRFYKQKLYVKFADANAAQAAQAEFLRFPEGRKFAYTTRWDDSNPRQLPLSKMLNAHKMKATCYANGLNANYVKVVKEMLAEGNAIGSHTMTHPFLGMLLPSRIFTENALQKIILESTFDTNVVASALPYHNFKSVVFPDSAKLVGASLLNAGYISAPDIHENDSKYSLPENRHIYSTSLFDANDSNPSETKYANGLKMALKNSAKRGDNHITLGVHSTQREGGIEVLGEILDKYASEDFWGCTENEYAAYRRQFENAKIKKTGVKGDVAAFEILRPAATLLGSDIPLSATFSQPAQKAALDSLQLDLKNNSVKLPHPKRFTIPTKIEHLDFSANGANNLVSKKFAGISLKAEYDKSSDKFSLKFFNNSDAKIEQISAAAILAPCYANADNENGRKKLLNKGDCFSAELKLQKNAFAKLFQEGDILYAWQIEFLHNGEPSRIYATTFDKNPIVLKNCPRDMGAVIGTLSYNDTPAEKYISLSNPKTILADFGDRSWEFTRSKRQAPYTLALSGKKVKTQWKPDALVIAVIDFEAPEDGEYSIFSDAYYARDFYLNGEKFKLNFGETKVKLHKGANRFLAAMKLGVLSFAVRDKNGNELKYLLPKLEQ